MRCCDARAARSTASRQPQRPAYRHEICFAKRCSLLGSGGTHMKSNRIDRADLCPSLLWIGVALGLVSSSAQAQNCDAVLRDNVRDEIQFQSGDSSHQTWDDFFCSKNFEDYARSRQGSATVTVTGYGSFGGDSQSQAAWSRRAEECRTRKGQQSSEAQTKLMQSFLSSSAPEKWRAWLACALHTGGSTSVISRGEARDGNLTVFFRWRAVTGAPAPVIRDVYALNADCPKATALTSSQVRVEETSVLCRHLDVTRGAVVVIETSAGSTTQDFPGNRCNLPAGTLSLQAEARTFQVVTTPIVTSISTRDAHCAKDCRGWRGYENPIVLTGAAGSTLANCSLAKLAGPNGWFEIMQNATVSQNQCSARVRVWTHPQVWRLSAQQHVQQEQWQRKVVHSQAISSCTDAVLSLGQDARNGIVTLMKPDGSTVSVAFGQTSEQLVLVSARGTLATYRYMPPQ